MDENYKQYKFDLIKVIRSYCHTEWGWHNHKFHVSTYGYKLGLDIMHEYNCELYTGANMMTLESTVTNEFPNGMFSMVSVFTY